MVEVTKAQILDVLELIQLDVNEIKQDLVEIKQMPSFPRMRESTENLKDSRLRGNDD